MVLRALAVAILFIALIDITTQHEEYPVVAQWQGPQEPLVWDPRTYYEFKMTVTVYNAVRAQTDSTPDIMASGVRIELASAHEYRYCAVSRDWLSRWGGPLNYGDTIWISGTDDLDGAWIVQDTMNSRYINRVDLLVHRNRKHGKFRGTMEVDSWTISERDLAGGDSVVDAVRGVTTGKSVSSGESLLELVSTSP